MPAANSLLDAIRQNKNNAAQQPLGFSGLGTSNAIGQTIQAKSGKSSSSTSTGLPSGSLGEQQGLEQANLSLSNVQDQNKSADITSSIQATEQEQKTDQTKQSLLTERRAQQADFKRKSGSLINQLETAKDDLTTRQKINGLEQAGFYIAQQDQDYMDRLDVEAKRRRLDDESTFRLELQKATLGDMYDLFQDDLAFKGMFNANERDFTRQLASIDINTAMAIGRAQIQESNTQAIFQGAGGMASAGAQYYAKSSQSTSQPVTPPETNDVYSGNTPTQTSVPQGH